MRSLTHPDYIRLKAREMRMEKGLTIDEIAERLALSRTTVYHWMRDLPALERKGRFCPGREKAAESNKRHWRRLREAAYQQGLAEFEGLSKDPLFRDFVCMFIAEGYKKCRNVVSVANSDATVVRLADHWIRRFTRRKVSYYIQYHEDQDLNELTIYWRRVLGRPDAEIRFQRKSNSGKLNGRNWRSRYGVLTVGSSDTYFRARLQAWMDCLQWSWLEFEASGA